MWARVGAHFTVFIVTDFFSQYTANICTRARCWARRKRMMSVAVGKCKDRHRHHRRGCQARLSGAAVTHTVMTTA